LCDFLVVLSTHGIKILVTVIMILLTISFITIYIVAFLVVHPSSLHDKQAAAVPGLKCVFWLWYQWSAISSKNINFIDKGELTNCKMVNTHCFSPLFVMPLWFNKHIQEKVALG